MLKIFDITFSLQLQLPFKYIPANPGFRSPALNLLVNKDYHNFPVNATTA